MRIHCPFCGERDLCEFSYLGDATVQRPDSVEKFYEAVYLRDNLAGRHSELWYHTFGCRGWLRVTRDTRTHAIFAVELCSQGASA
jgi:methylglutamate dehydrogenase subunit B